MATLFKNIISFGAAGRIDAAVSDRDSCRAELTQLQEQTEVKRAHANDELQCLAQAKLDAFEVLKRVCSVVDNLSVRDRQLLEVELEGLRVGEVSSTAIRLGTIKHASLGLSAGASTAMGAWTLVSAYGAASTGTAISTLSGAAATKATLAWFGLGSLSAGGGGTAAGALALGGVVAIPALAVAAAMSHVSASKTIKALASEERQLVKASEQWHQAGIVYDATARRARELIDVTHAASKGFEYELARAHAVLHRWGWLSSLVRRLRKFFFGRMYSHADLLVISQLGQGAAAFARIIDERVTHEE